MQSVLICNYNSGKWLFVIIVSNLVLKLYMQHVHIPYESSTFAASGQSTRYKKDLESIYLILTGLAFQIKVVVFNTVSNFGK